MYKVDAWVYVAPTHNVMSRYFLQYLKRKLSTYYRLYGKFNITNAYNKQTNNISLLFHLCK